MLADNSTTQILALSYFVTQLFSNISITNNFYNRQLVYSSTTSIALTAIERFAQQRLDQPLSVLFLEAKSHLGKTLLPDHTSHTHTAKS